jgi:hypothetical protein
MAPPDPAKNAETTHIVGIVTRMALFENVPVIDKYLLEDVPVSPGFDNHQVAPSKGSRMFRLLRVKRLYHGSPLLSTLRRPSRGMLADLAGPGVMRGSGCLENENSGLDHIVGHLSVNDCKTAG